MTLPAVALAAAVVGAVVAAGLMHLRAKRAAAARKAADVSNLAKLENYQLILDTIDRSNILLWWARVSREGSAYVWKIRTPPQLHENPIYRLASLIGEEGLWKHEQAPDHVRTGQAAEKALSEGAGGYQHEFRIIGSDGMHWLSEEVMIRPAGPNAWNLAGVIVDVTKRH